MILAAAGYQLTEAKARCLQRCRTPLSLAGEAQLNRAATTPA